MTTRIIAALLALLVAASPALAAQQSPRELVQGQAERVLEALVERRAEFKSEPAKLESFVLHELEGTFDRQYSARLVLGRHSRGVPDATIAAFADALMKNLMRRYGKAMLEFDPNMKVRVLSETPMREGKLMRVATEIQRAAGSPVPVDYMLRDVGGAWKVFDVLVEGVSYVQTYRTQFEEQLRRQTLDQVIEGLRNDTVRVEG
jgi:phospholipid transport system substrate-binding protein